MIHLKSCTIKIFSHSFFQKWFDIYSASTVTDAVPNGSEPAALIDARGKMLARPGHLVNMDILRLLWPQAVEELWDCIRVIEERFLHLTLGSFILIDECNLAVKLHQ